MVLRIGKINAQRSAAAAANLEILMSEKNQDILCLQEPFCYNGKVRWSLNSPNLIKIQQQNCEKTWVAAVVKNDKLDVLTNVGNKCEHITCFKVMTDDSEFIMLNAYCQYSLPLK